MSIEYNAPIEDMHWQCDLETKQLREELAAIRDANDEEIDACLLAITQSPKSLDAVLENLQKLCDIAKVRGRKIAELDDERDGMFNRDIAERAISELTAERDEAIDIARDMDVNGGMVCRERDEAIRLLKFLKRYVSRKPHLTFKGNSIPELNFKRIEELTVEVK